MKRKFEVVIAIDFGTTRSGFAYAFLSNIKNNIQGFNSWEYIKDILPSSSLGWKNITSLLYNKSESKYESWGAKANEEHKKHIKKTPNANNKYAYIREFKLKLTKQFENKKDAIYEENVSTSSGLGISLLVTDLVAETLKFIKEKALSEVQKNLREDEKSIKWVITVPVWWNDPDDRDFGRDLMIRAAKKAGLISSEPEDRQRLLLVSEPEAASIFCFKEKAEFLPSDSHLVMVLDCGGGTTDILTFKTEGASLSEVIPSSSGQYGSTKLDEEFRSFLQDKLQEEKYQDLRDNHQSQWNELMKAWENYKCTYDPISKTQGHLELHENDKTFKIHFEKGDIFSKEEFENLFDEKLDHISGIFAQVQKQRDLIKEKNLECKHLLVVGGYSRSKMLQKKLQAKFPDLKIAFPDDDGNAVLKGAVYFGIEPDLYRKRIATSTYGFDCAMPFEEGIDPIEYGQVDGWFWTKKNFISEITGQHLCNNRFSVFLPKGKTIELNTPIEKTFNPVRFDQNIMPFTIYKTNGDKIRYIDGCEKIHNFSVHKNKEWKTTDWSVKILLYCRQGGEIELEVYSVNNLLGKREPVNLSTNKTNVFLELSEV
jgi:molecular chaperone DnaK (HSP70)